MSINQITAMAAVIACGMRFGEFEPDQRDALVARVKATADNGKPPEHTCEDILGTEDASKTFDKVAMMLCQFKEESAFVDAILAKAHSMGSLDPLGDALFAMDVAKNLLGEHYALVPDDQFKEMIDACALHAEPGESTFETALRMIRAINNVAPSIPFVPDAPPVVPDVQDGDEMITVTVEEPHEP